MVFELEKKNVFRVTLGLDIALLSCHHHHHHREEGSEIKILLNIRNIKFITKKGIRQRVVAQRNGGRKISSIISWVPRSNGTKSIFYGFIFLYVKNFYVCIHRKWIKLLLLRWWCRGTRDRCVRFRRGSISFEWLTCQG